MKQFLSLRQRKALGMSHFKTRLLPGPCGFPGLQTHWWSQHFLWDIKTVVGSCSELWEIQLRCFIAFSRYVLRRSLLCGSSNMLGTAGRVSPAQKWFSHKAECTLIAVGKSYSLYIFMSSKMYLENTLFQYENQILEMKKCFCKDRFFCTNTLT